MPRNIAVNIECNMIDSMKQIEKMPVLFVGHGSPMNALAQNGYTQSLRELGKSIPKPKAVLVISAHWLTENWAITAMEKPRTIHDFYGFPPELFSIQYPAPGSPMLAKKIQENFKLGNLQLDQNEWGLDHGTWAILKHIFPHADLPVLQLSVAIKKNADEQLAVGETLRWCREEGILLVGSGNIVHNLKTIRWQKDAATYPWAENFDEWVKEKITNRDHLALAREYLQEESGKWSVPSDDHYFPLLNLLSATSDADKISFPFEGMELGSISLRTIRWG